MVEIYMASPQKENGFTPISNEILEALCRFRINGESRQVLDFIFRKTYGFNKREDSISLSQFVLATGLKKNTICKAISKLKQLNLITQKGNDIAIIYRFNKDFDTWKPLPKKGILPKKGMTITQKGNNRSPYGGLQKTVLKDTITKDSISKDIPQSVSTRLELLEYLKNKQELQTLDGSQRWNMIYAKHLLNRFKGDTDKIKKFIDYTLSIPFHKKNATTFKYLYNNLNKIALELKGQSEKTIRV